MTDRQRCRIAAAMLCLGLGSGQAAATIPVLDTTPACAYRKLGTVTAEIGTRVKEVTLDKAPPAASYPRVFDRLADAAQALGANAVVLRRHRATYFTRFGKRTREAVHVALAGAAIHIDGDWARCKVAVLDPREYQRSDPNLKLVETTSDKAYESE